MPRISEYDSKKRFHAPAFDYNIIQADDLVSKIKNHYGDILTNVNVRYDPPDSIIVEYDFDHKDIWYRARVMWQAAGDYDLVRIALNVWHYQLLMNNKKDSGWVLLKDQSLVTTGYIFKSIGDYLA